MIVLSVFLLRNSTLPVMRTVKRCLDCPSPRPTGSPSPSHHTGLVAARRYGLRGALRRARSRMPASLPRTKTKTTQPPPSCSRTQPPAGPDPLPPSDGRRPRTPPRHAARTPARASAADTPAPRSGKTRAVGAGGRVGVTLLSGNTRGVSPVVGTQPPGTRLVDGYESPEKWRPPRPATRGHDRIMAGDDPWPKFRDRGPPRGVRARHRRFNPASGSATSVGMPPRRLILGCNGWR